jgi:dihydroxyacetone kinase-like protein
MKKFINHVDDFLTESLAGFAAAHADLVVLNEDPVFVRRREPKPGKVALISGGGSGHEPLHSGFVGYGMLDAACPGQVFTSPTPDQMMAAAKAVDMGAGVLFIVKNYSGDVMNFEMASEMCEVENAMVLINDDVAVENSSYTTGRRGVAGTVIVEKLVGSMAESGASLEQCKTFGDRINKHTASMGVAFTSCTVPAAGTRTFKIGDDEIEVGVGIHGEPGRRRAPMASADAIAGELLTARARERAWRHAARRALSAFQLDASVVAAARPACFARAGRAAHDIAGDVGRIDHAMRARRRDDRPLGQPRACARPALGDVAAYVSLHMRSRL